LGPLGNLIVTHAYNSLLLDRIVAATPGPSYDKKN
jgi:hypothetical protein